MANGRMVPHAKTCDQTGKRGYTTRAGAKTAKRSIGGQGMSVYLCPDCGYWHVGHHGGKSRQFHRDIHTQRETGTLTAPRS